MAALGVLLAASLTFGPAEAQTALACASNLVAQCTPRDGGTPGGLRAAAWIRDAAAGFGADARLDPFTAETPRGARSFANVRCAFTASPAAPWVVLVSHFDTKLGVDCPGANDGAATSGLLLALAASWAKGPAPHRNVLLLWTDGEECYARYRAGDGLWGSRHAAAGFLREGRRIDAVLCLDMLGDRDLDAIVPINGTPDLATRVLDAAARANLPAETVRRRLTGVVDDHVPFLAAGFPAVDLIDFSYGPDNAWWHTREDTVDKLSAASLEKIGRLVVAFLEGGEG